LTTGRSGASFLAAGLRAGASLAGVLLAGSFSAAGFFALDAFEAVASAVFEVASAAVPLLPRVAVSPFGFAAGFLAVDPPPLLEAGFFAPGFLAAGFFAPGFFWVFFSVFFSSAID